VRCIFWKVICVRLAGLLGVGLSCAVICLAADANQVARLLAGLPLQPPNGLQDLMESPAWKEHAREFDRVWRSLEAQRLPAMDRFQSTELDRPEYRKLVLLYPFGGPDALHAIVLFPHHPVYVLIGLEPIGTLPGEQELRKDLDRWLGNTRASLESLLQRSFFVTREMDRTVRGQKLNGILPDILVQLARLGAEVLNVKPVHVAEGGVLAPWDRVKVGARGASNRGIEIMFRRVGEPPVQKLYFFTVNLGPRLSGNRAFLAYLDRTAPFVTFFKSTRYMPHHKGFATLRRKVLETSVAVLQDDSGIPFCYYQTPDWQVQLYGEYEQPYGSFRYLAQPDLRQAYATPGAAKKLEFRIGYGFSQVPSNLLWARRRNFAPAVSVIACRSGNVAPLAPQGQNRPNRPPARH